MIEQHELTVYLEDDFGPILGVRCPYDMADEARPCWPRDEIAERGDDARGICTYTKWIDGLRAGRSFVTNGPFVEVIAGGQHRHGETVRLAEPGKIKVVAKAWWHLPLRRAEIVQDGKVVATKEAVDGKFGEVWEAEIPFERSGWLAVRTSGPSHADSPGGEAFAHTSAVYVEVAGRPANARADAYGQAAPDSPLAEGVSKRYGEATNVRVFDGVPQLLTEMDALVAYLQILGHLTDAAHKNLAKAGY